jgi:predicted membrane protein
MLWAILFIAIGVILLLQSVFKIDLPILKILFGIFLIYMGVKVIAGSFGHKISYFKVNKITTETESIFSENTLKSKNNDGQVNRKFSTVFGSSKLDLSSLTDEELGNEIKIDNAFGKTIIQTNAAIPIKATVETGFAKVTIRGQSTSQFGETVIQTPDYSSEKPALILQIDAAFGEVIIN